MIKYCINNDYDGGIVVAMRFKYVKMFKINFRFHIENPVFERCILFMAW